MSWKTIIAVVLVYSPLAFAQGSPNSLLIEHVNVLNFDGTDDVLVDQSVWIENGLIQQITSADSLVPAQDIVRIDASGKFLLPGLIDMHVHVWDKPELLAYLSFGVTTVRNASGMPYLLDFQSQIESQELEGPRLITTGPIFKSITA